MTMKKRYYCVICLFLLFFFVSCGEHNMADTSNATIINNGGLENNAIAETIYISYWHPYEGDITIQDTELITLDEAFPNVGKIAFQGVEYIMLDFSVNTYISPESGWKINLNALKAKWKTTDGYIVLIPDDTNAPPMICTYENASGQIRCYLREDILDGEVELPSIDAFDFYYEGNRLQESRQLVEEIWYYHVGDEEFPKAVLVLDGEWDYYSIRMIYKDCPALQYEINIEVCNDLLYIENLSRGQAISIPIDQIRAQN